MKNIRLVKSALTLDNFLLINTEEKLVLSGFFLDGKTPKCPSLNHSVSRDFGHQYLKRSEIRELQKEWFKGVGYNPLSQLALDNLVRAGIIESVSGKVISDDKHRFDKNANYYFFNQDKELQELIRNVYRWVKKEGIDYSVTLNQNTEYDCVHNSTSWKIFEILSQGGITRKELVQESGIAHNKITSKIRPLVPEFIYTPYMSNEERLSKYALNPEINDPDSLLKCFSSGREVFNRIKPDLEQGYLFTSLTLKRLFPEKNADELKNIRRRLEEKRVILKVAGDHGEEMYSLTRKGVGFYNNVVKPVFEYFKVP